MDRSGREDKIGMNLKHLETFHHFCRFNSMSQAANYLHVSQPAVSQQLRIFEEECGVKLFYRCRIKFLLQILVMLQQAGTIRRQLFAGKLAIGTLSKAVKSLVKIAQSITWPLRPI